jgi:hypothetical protein
MRAFWGTAPSNLVGVDRRFRGAYCLHHHPCDETSVPNTTQRYIPNDSYLQTCRSENLKSHKDTTMYPTKSRTVVSKVQNSQIDTHSNENRVKEQNRPIRHPWQNTTTLGHRTQLQDTSILSKKSRHSEGIIRKTIQIEFHPNNTHIQT